MGSSRAKHSTRGPRASMETSTKPGSLQLSETSRPSEISWRSEPVATSAETLQPSAQSTVADIILRLKTVHAVVICAAHALRHQNTEIDGEVADTLRYCASDTLDAQIERLAVIAGEAES
jgi:hypothetical protein